MTENMQRILNDVALQMRQRSGEQTLSTTATIGGCCGLFDLCSDVDVLSLSMASEPFIDWIGWEKSDKCAERYYHAHRRRRGKQNALGQLVGRCARAYQERGRERIQGAFTASRATDYGTSRRCNNGENEARAAIGGRRCNDD